MSAELGARTVRVEPLVRCADVLALALEIIESGPLPESHSEHGEWCPYCALALAKGRLDDERNSGLSFRECMEELAFGFSFRESDVPLDEARKAVGRLGQPFTKSATVAALKVAIASNA